MKALAKSVIETALDEEMIEHLGLRLARAGRPEPVQTRDRDATLTPVVVTHACGDVEVDHRGDQHAFRRDLRCVGVQGHGYNKITDRVIEQMQAWTIRPPERRVCHPAATSERGRGPVSGSSLALVGGDS